MMEFINELFRFKEKNYYIQFFFWGQQCDWNKIKYRKKENLLFSISNTSFETTAIHYMYNI